MRRINFLCIFCTMCINVAYSQTKITERDACLTAVTRILDEYPNSNVRISDVSTMRNKDGIILMYEVETSVGINIILSANKACFPILCTHPSSEGLYLNQDSLPCGIRFFIDCYAEQVDSSVFFQARDYYERQWDSLINGEYPASLKSSGNVGPLIHSHWTQRLPNDDSICDAYNYFIESGSNCEHSLVGCTGVAMGQVMYYWKYPVISPYQVTQFDWCNMSNELHTSDIHFEKKRNRIAFLLRECARSINTFFGCNGSSAFLWDVDDALINRFGYDGHADYKRKLWYSNSDWKTMIKTDLNMGLPVIYGGQSTLIDLDGGHSFVCDGYNQYGEFHFNWGWYNTYSYDYFVLDDLTPGSHNYSYLQEAVFGIKPKELQDFCDITVELGEYYQHHFYVSNGIVSPIVAIPQTASILISAAANSNTPSSWHKIPSGSTATYRAHEEIVLQDGFEAEWGSDFTAEIVPCPACEDPSPHPIHPIFDSLFPQRQTEPDSLDGAIDAAFSHIEDFGFVQAEVYPNPTSGELTVVTDGMAETVVIYNAMGHPIGGWEMLSLGENWLTLDVSALPQGAYIIVIRTPTAVSAARFLRR